MRATPPSPLVLVAAALVTVVGCNLDFAEQSVESPATTPSPTDTVTADLDVDTVEPTDADTATPDDLDPDADVERDAPEARCSQGLPGLRHARTLTVTAGDDPVEAGYSVVFELPVLTLQDEGKLDAGLADLRLGWCREGVLELVPLAIDPTVFASGDFEATPLWFALQAPLEAGASTSDYHLLYGDPGLTEPVVFDWEGVFLVSRLWNDDAAMLAPDFETVTLGDGTVEVTPDGLTLRAPVANDAALITTAAPLPADRRVAIRHGFQTVSASDALVAGITALGIYSDSPTPSPTPDQGRVLSAYSSPLGHLLGHKDVDGGGRHWAGAELGWDTEVTALQPGSGSAALTYELFSDGDTWRLVVSDGALATLFETSPVAWSQTLGPNDDSLWFMWGDDYTTQNAVEGLATYTWIRRHVASEPVVELGPERTIEP